MQIRTMCDIVIYSEKHIWSSSTLTGLQLSKPLEFPNEKKQWEYLFHNI